jgi:hypothetical protein
VLNAFSLDQTSPLGPGGKGVSTFATKKKSQDYRVCVQARKKLTLYECMGSYPLLFTHSNSLSHSYFYSFTLFSSPFTLYFFHLLSTISHTHSLTHSLPTHSTHTLCGVEIIKIHTIPRNLNTRQRVQHRVARRYHRRRVQTRIRSHRREYRQSSPSFHHR